MTCGCTSSPSPWEFRADVGWFCIRCQSPVLPAEEDELGEKELMETGSELISRLLRKGRAQGHGAKTWLTAPIANHILKSSRHGLTAQLMLDNLSPSPDHAGEGAEAHLERAAIRALMALTIYQKQTSK